MQTNLRRGSDQRCERVETALSLFCLMVEPTVFRPICLQRVVINPVSFWSRALVGSEVSPWHWGMKSHGSCRGLTGPTLELPLIFLSLQSGRRSDGMLTWREIFGECLLYGPTSLSNLNYTVIISQQSELLITIRGLESFDDVLFAFNNFLKKAFHCQKDLWVAVHRFSQPIFKRGRCKETCHPMGQDN